MEYFAKIEESQNAERELASKMEQVSLEARQSKLQIQELQETVKSLNKTLIEKEKTIKDQSEKTKTLTEKHKTLSEKFKAQTAELNELNADLQFDKAGVMSIDDWAARPEMCNGKHYSTLMFMPDPLESRGSPEQPEFAGGREAAGHPAQCRPAGPP